MALKILSKQRFGEKQIKVSFCFIYVAISNILSTTQTLCMTLKTVSDKLIWFYDFTLICYLSSNNVSILTHSIVKQYIWYQSLSMHSKTIL